MHFCGGEHQQTPGKSYPSDMTNEEWAAGDPLLVLIFFGDTCPAACGRIRGLGLAPRLMPLSLPMRTWYTLGAPIPVKMDCLD